MGFNRVILMGRVTRDASINDARTVARYTLAVDKFGDGADFIDCVCFGKQIDFAEKHIKKGIKIAVEGHIQTGTYEKDGQKIKTTDVVIERHEFCESKKAETPQADMSIPEFGGFDGTSPFD